MKTHDWRKARRFRTGFSSQLARVKNISPDDADKLIEDFEQAHEEWIESLRYGSTEMDDDV